MLCFVVSRQQFMQKYLAMSRTLQDLRRERVELDELMNPTSRKNLSPIEFAFDEKLQRLVEELAAMQSQHDAALQKYQEQATAIAEGTAPAQTALLQLELIVSKILAGTELSADDRNAIQHLYNAQPQPTATAGFADPSAITDPTQPHPQQPIAIDSSQHLQMQSGGVTYAHAGHIHHLPSNSGGAVGVGGVQPPYAAASGLVSVPIPPHSGGASSSRPQSKTGSPLASGGVAGAGAEHGHSGTVFSLLRRASADRSAAAAAAGGAGGVPPTAPAPAQGVAQSVPPSTMTR